jgi:trans-aconitate methyltransferase
MFEAFAQRASTAIEIQPRPAGLETNVYGTARPMNSEFRWSGGEAYESYVGRWSRLVAAEFIPWLGVPSGATWIDVGCGTGELTRAILRIAAPSKVVSLDPSESYLDHARSSITDPRVEFSRGTDQDVRSLGVVADAVISGLVLNFVPDAVDALRTAAEATAPGGLIAAYVWDYADGMAMMRHFWDAAVEEDPAASSKDEGVRFPLCTPGALKSAFETAGLSGVVTRPIEVTDRFADFDEYWTPFLSGRAPGPGYLASLPAKRQARLREMVRNRLPIATDGSITMTCRAWAARGRRLPEEP